MGNLFSRLKMMAVLLLALSVIMGCGTGGMDTTTSSSSNPNPSPTPVPASAALTITGSVVDGFIVGATVQAYQVNANGTRGDAIGSSTVTGAKGGYSLNLTYSGPILVESTGGTYTDWSTGSTVALGPADKLSAVMSNAKDAVTIHITPLTHMAALRAQQDMTVNKTDVAAAIDAANSKIGEYFGGIGIINNAPIDPTASNASSGVSQTKIDHAMILAGISENARANNLHPFSLAVALARDAGDGVFDGKQGTTQLTVANAAGGGTTNLSGTAAKGDLSASITSFQSSAANKSGSAMTTSTLSALSSLTNMGVIAAKPNPPSGFTVLASSATQASLSWTASPGAAGYKIFKGGVYLKSVATASTSDSGLLPNTQYCYAISAFDGSGNDSSQTAQSCITTNLAGPPVPAGLNVTAVSQSQVNLTWDVSAGAVGYKVFKGGSLLKSVSTNAVSDSGLAPNTQYCYTVDAFDGTGNESVPSSIKCATTFGPPPSDPGNLTTFVETDTKVILNWSTSVGATEYYIYRNGTKIDTSASPVTGTTYTDTAATANAQNMYAVTARNAAGSESSGVSNQVTVNTALTVPSMSSATADTSSKITIGWANAGNGTQVAGYKIYRNGGLVQTIPSAETLTYTDSTGLSANTQYCYRVSAIDASGNESAQSSASQNSALRCATTPATVAGSMVLSLTKPSDGTTTTSVSVDSPANLTATVKDSVGSPIANAVISFSTVSDLSFNPASGTALTDENGAVTITVQAGNTTGAATIRAVTTDATGTAISGSVNLSMLPPTLSLSALTIDPATLSAGGSAAVSVAVMDSLGNPYMTSIPISFTSDGVQANKATITPQVYTVNGVASATYRDINYASDDTITATLSIGGTTFTNTGTIKVHAASAGSISFVSATPANIALKGTGGVGRSETSVVVFKVLDTNGNPIRKKVNFLLAANTEVGGLALTTLSADSDPLSGLVQTIVQAGTVSTPVRVSATIDGTTISTTSDQLVISTGIPDQDSFSLAVSTFNIEGWNYDGTPTDITASLADHYNNPVPDGTAVYFRSSGASIQPSCTTTNGTCVVKLTSQNPRPPGDPDRMINGIPSPQNKGRVVVLAYALGEESFVDLNGNGIHDAGEPYTDMPEPFLDANEDGVRDAAKEEFVDTNKDGSYSPVDGSFNGILRDNSGSGPTPPTTIHVRNSNIVVLSGSDAVIKIDGSAAPPALNIPPCTTTDSFIPGSVSFNVEVTDVNGNVMPAGTTISFTTTNGTILTTPTTFVVPSTTYPGTYTVTIQSDATQSGTSAPYTCENEKPSGIFTVTVATPKGISSYQYMMVND